MDWIKKNIPFVVSCVVALISIGASGYFLFVQMGKYDEAGTTLSAEDSRIGGFVAKRPHPGAGNVDNLAAMKTDIKRLQQFREDLTKSFKSTPLGVQTEQAFKAELADIKAQIERAGKRSGMTTPTNFNLSFTAQKIGFRFASNSVGPLSAQLADLREITRILLAARVNSIEAYKRVAVSADDKGANAVEAEYITYLKITTNDFTGAVVHPYEVTFRCFSEELGEVLEGISNSPYSIMLKTVAVEPAEVRNIKPLFASAASVFGDSMPYVSPTTDSINNKKLGPPGAGPGGRREGGAGGARPDSQMSGRYGGGGGARPAAAPAAPKAMATAPGETPKPVGPEKILSEEPVKVTLGLAVVRMPEAPAEKPADTAAKPAAKAKAAKPATN